jgi:hypothetical protein
MNRQIFLPHKEKFEIYIYMGLLKRSQDGHDLGNGRHSFLILVKGISIEDHVFSVVVGIVSTLHSLLSPADTPIMATSLNSLVVFFLPV